MPGRLLRDPAADRWTWLLIACHAQLYLARGLAPLTRMPWHPPARPADGVMTPGQVRAGFRRARDRRQSRPRRETRQPGPGRPASSKNKRKAARHPARKTNRKKRRPAKTPGKDRTDRLNGKLCRDNILL